MKETLWEEIYTSILRERLCLKAGLCKMKVSEIDLIENVLFGDKKFDGYGKD
jgi:hypothetical protein